MAKEIKIPNTLRRNSKKVSKLSNKFVGDELSVILPKEIDELEPRLRDKLKKVKDDANDSYVQNLMQTPNYAVLPRDAKLKLIERLEALDYSIIDDIIETRRNLDMTNSVDKQLAVRIELTLMKYLFPVTKEIDVKGLENMNEITHKIVYVNEMGKEFDDYQMMLNSKNDEIEELPPEDYDIKSTEEDNDN